MALAEKVTLRARQLTLSDRYVQLLFISLLGYATLSRGFAYVGIPPLFIGEILLVTGVILLLQSGAVGASIANVPMALLATFIAYVAMRATLNAWTEGIDALRDAVIVIYGTFAFIVVGLILERPQRINEALNGLNVLAKWVVPASPFLYVLSKSGRGIIPAWPSNGVLLADLRPGEMAVHLTGAAMLTLLGFRRATPMWVLFLVVGMVIVFAQSRGGALAMAIPLLIVVVVTGRFRQLFRFLAVAGVIFAAAYALDVEIKLPGGVQGGERALSVRQMTENVISLIDDGGSQEGLEGTKMFRLAWWQSIWNYTFHGDYFWTGKGFGINLAEADGFVVGREIGGPPLRSPHNGHMTILARTGVPGFLMWGAILASWFLMTGLAMLHARLIGAAVWSNSLLFTQCYLLSVLINATFDVALEGPMLGIWFWVMFGFGIALTLAYRCQLRQRK